MTVKEPTVHFSDPPSAVDQLIVHQFDPSRPLPGGINTCLRGICTYFPEGQTVAVIGVDTGSGPEGRRIGRWEYHQLGDRAVWFLPVAQLAMTGRLRRIPHGLRVAAGLIRFRHTIPRHALVQAHRLDLAVILRSVLRTPQLYFIHTQENGLASHASDSLWRFAGGLHRRLERGVVRRATAVFVFNEGYTRIVQKWNHKAVFSPTWFDPALIQTGSKSRDPHSIVWVGRLEAPKDPRLAIRAFHRLVERDPGAPWTLDVLGSGSLHSDINAVVAQLPALVRNRVAILGRVPPPSVAERMARSGVFLMTSQPGYEGYPTVLVESLASGLPAVVTAGSDTGGLVVNGSTGFVCDRDPDELAARLIDARSLNRDVVADAVASLDAPTRVHQIVTHASGGARQSTRPTVGILVSTLSGGGAEFVAVQWATYLHEHGYDVTVITTHDCSRDSIDGIAVVSLRATSFLSRIIELRAHVARGRYDAIVSIGPHWNILALLSIAGRHKRSPAIVISGHTIESGLRGVRGRKAEIEIALARRLYRRADAYVAVSHPVAAEAASFYRIDYSRMWVVPNPATAKTDRVSRLVSREHGLYDSPDGQRTVTLVIPARLVRHKRPELAVHVADRLRSDHGIVAKVEYFGAGPEENRVSHEATRLGIDISFRGWVAAWFSECARDAVVLLPTRVEGFGNVFVEAAAVGIPSVASSRALGVADAIVPHVTGILCQGSSASDFAVAIVDAMDLVPVDEPEWLRRFSADSSGRLLSEVLDAVRSRTIARVREG